MEEEKYLGFLKIIKSKSVNAVVGTSLEVSI